MTKTHFLMTMGLVFVIQGSFQETKQIPFQKKSQNDGDAICSTVFNSIFSVCVPIHMRICQYCFVDGFHSIVFRKMPFTPYRCLFWKEPSRIFFVFVFVVDRGLWIVDCVVRCRCRKDQDVDGLAVPASIGLAIFERQFHKICECDMQIARFLFVQVPVGDV